MSETLDSTDSVDARRNDMIYTIEDCPPWYLCVFLGLQVRQTWNLTVTVLGMYWKRLPGISHLCFHLQRWKGTWQNFTLHIMNQEKTQNVPSFNLIQCDNSFLSLIWPLATRQTHLLYRCIMSNVSWSGWSGGSTSGIMYNVGVPIDVLKSSIANLKEHMLGHKFLVVFLM